MIEIFKRISVLVSTVVLALQATAAAYNIVDLPHSMTFADALGIFDVSDIRNATISDLSDNAYIDLTNEQIVEFYERASNVTVWRKTNPSPFRGACINFTTNKDVQVSYYFDNGIQIGTYGDDNYVCYMPAKDDAAKLTYIESDFYDAKDTAFGGTLYVANTSRDFLKLPEAEWAQYEMQKAASKNLLPYEFTNKYEDLISREELCKLIANMITVAGNYPDMDSYMRDTGNYYRVNVFSDCVGREEAIDQLYALGIITGKSDTIFDPDAQLTREEAAVILTRTATLFMYVGTDFNTKSADYRRISSWADYSVRWTRDKGIFSVDDKNYFNPSEPIPVQQAVTAVSRLFTDITYWES